MAESGKANGSIFQNIVNSLKRSFVKSFIQKIEERRWIEKETPNDVEVLWKQTENIAISSALSTSSSTGTLLAGHEIIPGKEMKFPFDIPTIFADMVNPKDKTNIEESADGFKIEMDINPFKQSEIDVDVKDNILIISAVHEEKVGKSGMIRLRFIRKYAINNSIDKKSIKTSYSSNGNLIISGSKLSVQSHSRKEKVKSYVVSKKIVQVLSYKRKGKTFIVNFVKEVVHNNYSAKID